MKIAISASHTVDATSNYGVCKQLGTLADSLVDQNHAVTLFAYSNSKTKATLFTEPRFTVPKEDEANYAAYQMMLQSTSFDILHSHNLIPLYLSATVKTPICFSIMWGHYTPEELKLFKTFNTVHYIAQSEYIRDIYPELNWAGVIYNAVNTNDFKPIANPTNDYLLYLGRILENKGPHTLVQHAQKLGESVIIAGQIEDQQYFDTQIKPFLSEKIRYIGEIGYAEKIKLLQNAKALVNAGLVKEACSNTIIEALACGTPVVAVDAGSNKELVHHGISGFISPTPEDLSTYLMQIHTIDRVACRKEAVERFSGELFAQNHTTLYKKIIEKNTNV